MRLDRLHRFGHPARSMIPRNLDDVLIVSLVVFLSLLVLVESRIAQQTDEAVVNEMDERKNPHLTTAMTHITHMGSLTTLWTLAIPVAGFFIYLKRFDFAMIQLTLLGGAMFIIEVVKNAVQRSRPFGGADWSTYSFPSGHTLAAMTFYFSLFFLISLLQEDRRVRDRLRMVGAMTAGMVGFSRVYLAVHYPTDVIAGIALACVWMAVVGLAYLRFLPDGHRKSHWMPHCRAECDNRFCHRLQSFSRS